MLWVKMLSIISLSRACKVYTPGTCGSCGGCNYRYMAHQVTALAAEPLELFEPELTLV